jgi:hypothetical protein
VLVLALTLFRRIRQISFGLPRRFSRISRLCLMVKSEAKSTIVGIKDAISGRPAHLLAGVFAHLCVYGGFFVERLPVSCAISEL